MDQSGVMLYLVSVLFGFGIARGCSLTADAAKVNLINFNEFYWESLIISENVNVICSFSAQSKSSVTVY